MKTTIVKHSVRRMTKKQRLGELKTFVNICFAILEEKLDYKEICNKTHLSLSTIMRLATNEFSLCVRFGTIQALGYAAGLKFTSTETGYTVAIVE